MSRTTNSSSPPSSPAHVDYIVVGAGTQGMSFIDTLLAEDASATVLLVDRNPSPGGHWTSAYPHVRLHQPACNYGVNSLPLGRNRDKKGNERYDIRDRSSGREIAEYYSRVAEQFRRSGRVRLCLGCEYECSEEEGGEVSRHVITNATTGEFTHATCRKVVVTTTNVKVPSMRGPPFPVDDSVDYVPCNDLPERLDSARYNKYVVIGAGKTGMDSVTHMLRNGVDPSRITWIVSRDVWVMLREGFQKEGNTHFEDMDRILSPLVRCPSLAKVWEEYIKDGIVAQIDEGRPPPTVFKGATINNAELAGLRTVEDVMRMGRVTGIEEGTIKLERGTLPLSSPSETLVVDCMADMDMTFYGYSYEEDGYKIFDGDRRINLGTNPTVFNPSLGSAIIAYVEATFSDEMDKNRLLYIPRKFGGIDLKPKLLFEMLYMQSKTFAALGKYKPAMDMVMKSRTNGESPQHHGGLAPFLWGMFGPLRIAKKGDLFVRKVESGGFEDVQDCFGLGGRKLPSKSDILVKKSEKKKKKGKKSAYPPPVETKPTPTLKASKRLNCCATVEIVQ